MAEEIDTNAATGENTQVGAPAGDITPGAKKSGTNAKGGAISKQEKKPGVKKPTVPAEKKNPSAGKGSDAPTPGAKSEDEVLAEAAQQLMTEHNLKAIFRSNETGNWFSSEEFAKENCGHKFTPYLKD